MAWVIGIDEAGYGPNLGPFVMTAVALRVPDDDARDLWQRLAGAVRRDTDPDDGRLLVADSKVVYSAARGLGHLENAVLAAHLPSEGNGRLLLERYIEGLYASSHAALRRERWYSGTTALPVAVEPARCAEARERFAAVCRQAGVVCGLVRGVVVCPEQFNALTEAAGSKGAVLRHGLAELVRECWRLDADEPLTFFIDKHGGRNTYAAMLQDAVPEGIVLAYHESAARSVYGVAGIKRAVRWTFQPRADAEHFSVALASMVSKYVREVLMAEFNRFWQEQVPGLKPTAGYPGDARRFHDAIRPAAERLGIPEAALWRRK
jgi:ribonuclease HII